ncbi:MAG: RNA-binding S4 domain-containing protein [Saprospiraceae bacterium]|nr:RNA-binding S4 domain-containing protein [Saprospiraceae bacterium]
MTDLKKIRLDKWLWAVRLFKSRTMSTDACKAGKVKLNGNSLKPSYLLTIGETIEVKKNGFNLTFKVNQLLEKRVSAVLAAPCFEDLTPQDELNKYKDWFVGKSGSEFRDRGEGRPTKKDRRELDDFKVMYFEDEEEGI